MEAAAHLSQSTETVNDVRKILVLTISRCMIDHFSMYLPTIEVKKTTEKEEINHPSIQKTYPGIESETSKIRDSSLWMKYSLIPETSRKLTPPLHRPNIFSQLAK